MTPEIRSKARISPLTSSALHCSSSHSQFNKVRKRKKVEKIPGKVETKLIFHR
jgi:hypothetical protein